VILHVVHVGNGEQGKKRLAAYLGIIDSGARKQADKDM